MKNYQLCVLAGVILIILSFIYSVVFAGIPYQDPPLYLLQRYAFHETVSKVILTIGFVFVLVGVVASFISHVSKKK